MREIKFRCWEKDEEAVGGGTMWPVRQIDFDVRDAYLGLHSASFDDLVFMQFTGLHDKNGKDVFEGDIVRCGEYEGDHDTKNYEIVYNEDGTYPAFDLKGWRNETNGISFFLNDGYIEIIGNIYENPDLLKQ